MNQIFDDEPKGVDTLVLKSNSTPFVQKTFTMITSCCDKIARWTTDGEMFVIKNIERFEKEIIPQYFDHNQYTSFARQLNFYGFSKKQTKPIRISDCDSAANDVAYYNENFKRGRIDLLSNIVRRTRGSSGKTQRNVADLELKVAELTDKVEYLKNEVEQMNGFKERLSLLEKIILFQQQPTLKNLQNQQNLQNQSQNSLPADITGFKNNTQYIEDGMSVMSLCTKEASKTTNDNECSENPVSSNMFSRPFQSDACLSSSDLEIIMDEDCKEVAANWLSGLSLASSFSLREPSLREESLT